MFKGRNQFNCPSLEEIFREKYKINEQTGCWEWTAGKNSDGYGNFNYNKKTIRAHRASYLMHKGEIPKGIMVCHHCDNPPCVNPEHLFLGTAKDNDQDSRTKGRQPTKDHPSLTSYSMGCRCDKCKEMNSAYNKKQYEKNIETDKARMRKNYLENKELRQQQARDYYINNKEAVLAYKKIYRAKKREK